MQPPRVIELPSAHHSPRGAARIAAVVIHATAGVDSRKWLQSNPRGVSAHALISRDGALYRMVPDERAAHHCGKSRIVVAGKVSATPNQHTLGVELENLNDGVQPYPQAQLAALGWLLSGWATRYPDARLMFHRDVDTQGKSDPAGLDWPAVYAAIAPWLPTLTRPAYSPESPLIALPGLARDALAAALMARCRLSPYEPAVIAGLGRTYYDVCTRVGVDPVPAAAQMCHETGNLTSPRSQPPQRNLAGIGATNDGAQGLGFPSLEAAVRAHVGRLVAYAVAPDARTPAQDELAAVALAARPLPLPCQGSAPTLALLGEGPNPVGRCGWASPGLTYGVAVAAVARALVELV